MADQETNEKQDEYVVKLLEKALYTEDETTYSFKWNGKHFTFKTPTFLDKTKIKAIHSRITRCDGSPATMSSTYEIYGSGDLSLMYSTAVLTHTSVLMLSPNDLDIETLEEDKIHELGELILLAEKRYRENKKKQSSKEP